MQTLTSKLLGIALMLGVVLAAKFAGGPAVVLFGVRAEFLLFGLTLLGVAVLHHRTFEVAVTGLAFILLLKLGSVPVDYFTQKFGVDPRQRFAAPLRTLTDWGFLTQHNGTISINRAGLRQVDRLLHEFFLPEHNTGRYA